MLSYEQWQQLEKSNTTQDILAIANFGNQFPRAMREYQERKRTEELKRREILQIKDRNKRQDAIARNLTLFQ